MSANFSVELLSDRNNSNRRALPVKRLQQLPSKLGEEFTTLNDRKLQRKQSHHPPTILSIWTKKLHFSYFQFYDLFLQITYFYLLYEDTINIYNNTAINWLSYQMRKKKS